MERQYLALDLGAESGRAIVGKLGDHKLQLTEVHRFPNTPVQLPSGLYWDSLRLFHEICQGIRAARQTATELEGIGIDTWGVDFGLLGPDGELLQNPRHYRDPRTNAISQRVFETVPREEIFRQTGIQFMDINSLYQLYAIRRDSPHILEMASTLLFMPDLFNYFLTGTAVAERTIASTSQFYDPVTQTLRNRHAAEARPTGGNPAELADPGTEIGALLPYLRDYCSFSRDMPVFATGSHDTASAIAAVPAEESTNWCYISSGTWSLMGVEVEEPIINAQSLGGEFHERDRRIGQDPFLEKHSRAVAGAGMPARLG